MGRAREQEQVDLDIDVLAPPARTFRLRGNVYQLPREVPIITALDCIRIGEEIEAAPEGTELAPLYTALHDAVLELVQVAQPDVTRLVASERELLLIVGLAMNGPAGATAAEAALEALDTGGATVGEDGEVAELPPTPSQGKQSGAGGRSQKRSPAASSA